MSLDKQKPSTATPDSFFVVHCEPPNANDLMFKSLVELVQMADKYNVKLTLQFTPQWAEMILSDKQELNLLRQWQRNGHEVAAQHHGPSVYIPWDGYTNKDNWRVWRDKAHEETRRMRIQTAQEQKRMVKGEILGFQGWKEKYLGAMDDYVTLLNKLASPETVKTATMTDKDTDWPPEIPYSTDGFDPEEAVSRPELVNASRHSRPHVGQLYTRKVYELGMGFLGDPIRLNKLKEEYLSVKEGEVFGVVTHEFNFARTPEIVEEWFKFLKEQDPEGKHNKTVSMIMEDFLQGSLAENN